MAATSRNGAHAHPGEAASRSRRWTMPERRLGIGTRLLARKRASRPRCSAPPSALEHRSIACGRQRRTGGLTRVAQARIFRRVTQPTRTSVPFPLRAGRGIPLFTVLGIRVVADYSWFLIVTLIAATLTVGWFPSVLPGRSLAQYIALGVITAFFFFASVLVHELSHSIVAVLNGIPVRRITLFLFGGVAEITKEPSDPKTELRVALAGPATSAVLAVFFWAVVLIMSARPGRPAPQLAFLYLAVANTFLLIFNLLPGLPLDGGRVLRAILWRATGDLTRATYVASVAGKALAGLLVLAGLFAILSGSYIIPGLWLIFIALFLRQAADSSYRQVLARQSLGGALVRNAMTEGVVTVPSTLALSELVDTYFLNHPFVCYPVVDGAHTVGLITVKDVKHVPRARWESTTVADTMTRLDDSTVLAPGDSLPTAVVKMSASGCGRLPVIDGGRLIGMLTRRDIMSYLRIKSDLST
jgi:Zn-dependent protease/CBS domain-containing protein